MKLFLSIISILWLTAGTFFLISPNKAKTLYSRLLLLLPLHTLTSTFTFFIRRSLVFWRPAPYLSLPRNKSLIWFGAQRIVRGCMVFLLQSQVLLLFGVFCRGFYFLCPAVSQGIRETRQGGEKLQGFDEAVAQIERREQALCPVPERSEWYGEGRGC